MRGCHRILAAQVLLFAVLTLPATALELRWSGGASNIDPDTSKVYTLCVSDSTGTAGVDLEQLRVAWIAQSAAPVPFELLETSGASGQNIVVGVTQDVSHGSRDHTLTVAPYDPIAPTIVCYQMRVLDPDARITFQLVPQPLSAPAGLATARVATIGGGASGLPPPVVHSAERSFTDGSTYYQLRVTTPEVIKSIGLDDDGLVESLDLVTRDAHHMLARGSNRDGLAAGRIVLTSPTHTSTVESVIDGDDAFIQAAAPRALTIRFQPGSGPSAAVGSEYLGINLCSVVPSELHDALASAGVVALRKAFPSFTPGDRFTTNLIGEPIVVDDLSTVFDAQISALHSPEEAAPLLAQSAGVYYVVQNEITQGLA